MNNLKKYEEKKLIVNLRAGDEYSFCQLYQYWGNTLYQFVYGFVKSESITDDIIQETFVSIWVHRRTLDENLSFKSYLFTIAYHLILKEFRQQLRSPSMENYVSYLSNYCTSDNVTEEKVEYDQFCSALSSAKSKLTSRQCEIFEMNKEQNISIKEIAAMLSISEQVVRNQLSASMKIIRYELKDDFLYTLIIMLLNI